VSCIDIWKLITKTLANVIVQGQSKIEGLEGKIKAIQTYVLDLEAQIMDLKAMDDNGMWKSARKEEVYAL
jgi:uncharacterized coiled-coil DUF342 family protein